MSITPTVVDACLRFGVGASGPESRTGSGVVIFDSIPLDSTVYAFVDRPANVNGAIGAPGEVTDGGVLQPYAFEIAPLPPQFVAGGTGITIATPNYSTRQTVLVPDSRGRIVKYGNAPVWAALSPAQTGSLRQKGRKSHNFVTPGSTTFPKDRCMIRIRWTATAVTSETQTAPPLAPNTPNGTTRDFTGQLGNTAPKTNIAPGSVSFVATVTAAALTLRDDGYGNLIGVNTTTGANGWGFIDYLTGKYELHFGNTTPALAPDNATNLVANYEHSCLYKPLDIHMSWDSLTT